jgi:hypothetical protein
MPTVKANCVLGLSYYINTKPTQHTQHTNFKQLSSSINELNVTRENFDMLSKKISQCPLLKQISVLGFSCFINTIPTQHTHFKQLSTEI